MNVLYPTHSARTPNVQALVDGQEWDDRGSLTRASSLDLDLKVLLPWGGASLLVLLWRLKMAPKSTPAVPELHLHAAHAYFQLKEFEAVLRHARAASSLAEEVIAQPS